MTYMRSAITINLHEINFALLWTFLVPPDNGYFHSSRQSSFSSLLLSSLWSPSSLPSCPSSTSTLTSRVATMTRHLPTTTTLLMTRAVPSSLRTGLDWTTRNIRPPLPLRPTSRSQKENRFGTRVVRGYRGMEIARTRAGSSYIHNVILF